MDLEIYRDGETSWTRWKTAARETPFGGFGKSGYGCEKGRHALWNGVQTKTIAIRLKGQLMSTFDEDLFLKGLAQRKATLGAEYVEKNLAAADDGVVLGLWLGRRCDRPKDAVDDEPRHDRGLGQDA